MIAFRATANCSRRKRGDNQNETGLRGQSSRSSCLNSMFIQCRISPKVARSLEPRLLVDEFAKQAALEEHIGSNRIGVFVDQVCEVPRIFGREVIKTSSN